MLVAIRVTVLMTVATMMLAVPAVAAGPSQPRALPESAPTAAVDTSVRAAAKARCTPPRKRIKRPDLISLPDIKHSSAVIPVRRTRSGAAGAPPLNRNGKWVFARDRQVLPGARRGAFLLAAHTWPDGTALGNRLLRRLKVGDDIDVFNRKRSRAACYRVTKREQYPVGKVPRNRAFKAWGKHKLVIVVCSGKRLGPGRWSHRTLWYARPTHVLD